MRLQFGGALFPLHLCYALIFLAKVDTVISAQHQEKQLYKPLIYGAPIITSEARAARIAEFVTSHKIPDAVQEHKNARLFDDVENRSIEDRKEHPRVHVMLENYGRTGLLYDQKLLLPLQQYAENNQDNTARNGEDILSSISVSSDNPTTMLPVLTTPRDTRSFDFVPVNIIREDTKGNPFSPLDNKNFEDLGDVGLIPAGSNTRIQVKKGPNGKDYEYEYVYYYYDEEDESKADVGMTAKNSQEVPTRTSTPKNLRRGSNSNRNKYSTLDRTTTTTVEPVINEVLPSGNSNRARQLEAAVDREEVFNERLPTNTRFPPRAGANHAAETIEQASRGRGNRQRIVGHETVDSSSFRSANNAHLLQEGPEFPQNLPNGPIRFLGVTPNEGNEDKSSSSLRSRGRPQRIPEPAPVEENYEEPQDLMRKRLISGQYENVDQYDRGQSKLHHQSNKNKDEELASNVATSPVSSSTRTFERDAFSDVIIDITDSPTTQVSYAMDKVALDLYAFLQQGRNNFVDFVKEAGDLSDGNNLSGDSLTTELPDTTFSGTESDDAVGPTTSPPATTIPASTISSTVINALAAIPQTTSEESSTVTTGRTKFRRPGVSGPAILRNRFKSNVGASLPSVVSAEVTTTEISSPIQRSRGRFGANRAPGAGGEGFKRAKPSLHKSTNQQTVLSLEDSTLQKDDAEKLSKETKSLTGRGRYRGGSARSGTQSRTTVAPNGDKQTVIIHDKVTNTRGSASHRASSFNKLGNINRRRGNRPTIQISSTVTTEEAIATEPTSTINTEKEISSEGEVQQQASQSFTKLPIGGARVKPLNKPIIKPGAGRLNLRSRLGQQTTTTESAPAIAGPSETAIDEPASEGTEEETREAPAESNSATRPTTVNPLNKLRNRNRIQVHPKTTTARMPLPPAVRRSHLLPRRKTTEVPSVDPAENSTNSGTSDEFSVSTENQPQPQQLLHTEVTTITTSSTPKQEEIRGLSTLLASRRRLIPRKPGQSIVSPTSSTQ